jgi:hypothetical protein
MEINQQQLEAMRSFHGFLRKDKVYLQPLTDALQTVDRREKVTITLPFEVLAPRKSDTEHNEKKEHF